MSNIGFRETVRVFYPYNTGCKPNFLSLQSPITDHGPLKGPADREADLLKSQHLVNSYSHGPITLLSRYPLHSVKNIPILPSLLLHVTAITPPFLNWDPTPSPGWIQQPNKEREQTWRLILVGILLFLFLSISRLVEFQHIKSEYIKFQTFLPIQKIYIPPEYQKFCGNVLLQKMGQKPTILPRSPLVPRIPVHLSKALFMNLIVYGKWSFYFALADLDC